MVVKTPLGRKARRRERSRSRSGANSSEENEDCQTRSSQGWEELSKEDIFEYQASSNNCKKIRWVAYDEQAQTKLRMAIDAGASHLQLTLYGVRYTVDFVTWKQYNQETGYERNVCVREVFR
jgi:hypothetical protein